MGVEVSGTELLAWGDFVLDELVVASAATMTVVALSAAKELNLMWYQMSCS